MTIELLICSLNKGIVRIGDILLPPQEGLSYLIAFQYTDERYLDLIPTILSERKDVRLFTFESQGLSLNRNNALDRAEGDIIIFADDDARFDAEGFEHIKATFEQHSNVDVAFFQASTYTEKPLKEYPITEIDLTKRSAHDQSISIIEMACLRTKVQGRIRFDERFGLGTAMLTCGEEEIWLEDARRAGLRMRYFPIKMVETSTLLKKQLLYVDPGVQRSYAAIRYYIYGGKAWYMCLKFAIDATRRGMAHFLPLMRNFAEGIRFLKHSK